VIALLLGALLCFPAEDPVSVTVAVEPVQVVENQVFTLTVRARILRTFEDAAMVPLVLRRLDVPIRLNVPWLADEAGLRIEERAVIGAESASVARNGDEIRVRRRSVDDATVLELEYQVVAPTAGPLELSPVSVDYAFATRFRDDLFGRVPEDRHDAVATSAPILVEVRPLPRAGAPDGFAGAVGRFSMAAEATESPEGEVPRVRLTVTLFGEGYGGVADELISDVPGFHVLGRLSERSPPSDVDEPDDEDEGEEDEMMWREVLDLTPRAATEIPALSFAFFDPSEGAYRTATTEPIAISVRASSNADPLSSEPGDVPTSRPRPGVNDLFPVRPIDTRSVGGSGRGGPGPGLAFAVVTPWLVFGVWLVGHRRRERRRRDPLGERARSARGEALRRVRRGDDPVDAFVGYLAARLRVGEAGVIGPELVDRLHATGVPASTVEEVSSWLERVRAPRFGATRPTTVDASEVIRRVSELELAMADGSPR